MNLKTRNAFQMLGNDKTQKQNRIIWIFLLLIILLGSFSRLQGVLTNSFAFTYDVGRDMLALSNIIHTHKIPLIGFTTGLPGVFYGPWWYIFLSVPYIIVRGNPQGIAGFLALIGIATIILVFLIGVKIANETLGLIFALFVSISPALVAVSSQIWNPNIAPLFVSLVFLIIIRVHRQEKLSWVVSGSLGLLLGFMFDIEIVFGTLFFVSIITSLVIFFKKHIRGQQIAAFLAGMVIMFSPRILFELRHHFLMTQTVLLTLLHSTPHAGNIGSQFLQRFIFFVNLWADSLSGHNVLLAMVMIVFCIITSVAFYRKTSGRERMLLVIQWIVIIVYLFGLTFFSHDIWPHYTVAIPLIYSLLFGMCLYLWLKTKKAHSIVVLMVFLLFWINFQPFQVVADMGKPVFTGDASVYRNQVAVIDYVYHQAHGRKFKYIVYTPPVYDYTYQYLFMWYGRRMYAYTPEKNDAHMFFVIIEPDSEKPSRLVDWLKTREHDGVITAQRVMKGGIIVQTREVR